MRMYVRDQPEIAVMQSHHNRDSVVLPALISTILCMIIYWYRKMDLNRTSAGLLMMIYAIYLTYSVLKFYDDQD